MRSFTSELLKSIISAATLVRMGRVERELDTLERARPHDDAERKQLQQRENLVRMELSDLGGFVQDARDEHPELAGEVMRVLPGNVQTASISDLRDGVARAGSLVRRDVARVGLDPTALVQSGVSPEDILERGNKAVALLRVSQLLDDKQRATTPETLAQVRADQIADRAFVREKINTGTRGFSGDAVRKARDIPDPAHEDADPEDSMRRLETSHTALANALRHDGVDPHAVMRLASAAQAPANPHGEVADRDPDAPGFWDRVKEFWKTVLTALVPGGGIAVNSDGEDARGLLGPSEKRDQVNEGIENLDEKTAGEQRKGDIERRNRTGLSTGGRRF